MDQFRITFPTPFGKDLYETWWKIEKSIRKFDRIFNKVEKFDARKFTDPENHERREKRMLERKRQRQTEHYTYFLGGLTEEEQMYRDYYETDVEADAEDDVLEEELDEAQMVAEGGFQFKKYDFVETSLLSEPHENFEDIVESKIFKFKYRRANDDEGEYSKKEGRVIERFMERAKVRDPVLETDLFELYQKDLKDSSTAQFMLDPSGLKRTALDETRKFREYMVTEAIQQYKDYFQDDPEEQQFFQYLDNLSNRDKIRFVEIFKDYTQERVDYKDYIMIEKREHNPELSLFSNLVLDLVDFKDRVRPLAKDIALMDVSRQYQKQNPVELEQERQEFAETITRINQEVEKGRLDEGYSSRELESPDNKQSLKH